MIENNIKYIREDMEMTQKELGYIFGVHDTTVSGWETGKDIIPLQKLVKLSNLSNYSVDFILNLTRHNINYSKLEKANPKIVGANLKKIRKEHNLTQQDIADSCSISQTTYSNYELGLYLINTLCIYTIAKKYNVSIDKILGKNKEQ